jgi:hypothetical protein
MEEKPEITGKEQGKGKPPIETQFKPGQSGNPAGRPKGTLSLVSLLKRKLAEYIETTDEKKITYAEALIIEMLKKALKDGDVAMIRDIMDRIDGRPTQRTELTGKDGEPIEFKNIRDDFRSRILGIATRIREGKDTE